MPITPTSSRAILPFIPPVENANPSNPSVNTPAANPAPLPPVAGGSQARPSRPGAGQGALLERNLHRIAAGMEQTSGSAQRAQSKKQRLEAAKARLKEKKQASRKDTLQNKYGVATEQERKAIVAGFKNKDGTADSVAYGRNVRERLARDYMDTTGNHPFRKADGTADLTAYGQHIREQSARKYTDAAGNHPFRKADGTGDISAYNQNVNQQRQEDDAVSALLAMIGL